MKTLVAVTLIIMGSLIVITPVISDYLFQLNVVTLLIKTGAPTATLEGRMSDLYRIGCWATGLGMVGVAVMCSLFEGQATTRPETVVTHGA
jgi:hypothetical protein